MRRKATLKDRYVAQGSLRNAHSRMAYIFLDPNIATRP